MKPKNLQKLSEQAVEEVAPENEESDQSQLILNQDQKSFKQRSLEIGLKSRDLIVRKSEMSERKLKEEDIDESIGKSTVILHRKSPTN